jgi:F0F1-type ATP synthase assembly protein I
MYRKAVLLQIVIAVPMVLVAGWVAGSIAALSAAAGGFAVVLGSLAYVFLARESKVTAVSAGAVLRRHLFAELAKVLVILGAMLGAFVSGWFSAEWLVASVAVAVLGHSLSLFFSK